MKKIDYSMLPEHMREGTQLYIERGIITGGFLTAVMSNNLVEAFARADDTNTRCMKNWAEFLYTEAPAACRGSLEAIEKWKAIGGLNGIYASADRGTPSA